MAWTIPGYSRAQVDAAGRALVSPLIFEGQLEEALEIVGNWRSSHNYPLNTFQSGLRKKARQIDPHSLVAQRIKRLSSIRHKLARFPTHRLSQMQDIGGCRAVVGTVSHVVDLVEAYLDSDIKHELVDVDDYIHEPKASGYRSVHIVYRYFSDKNDKWNGLKTEIQLRSRRQHAWATAVETVGAFIRQALKSSLGEENWLRFFALMGTAIAMRERYPPVPKTPTSPEELKDELQEYVLRLDVINRLRAYGEALQTLEEPIIPDAHYFLLQLDPSGPAIRVLGYKKGELDKANHDYLNLEKMIAGTGTDVVLVSVESIDSLRQAYPNYFVDSKIFIAEVQGALGGSGRVRRRTTDYRQGSFQF